MKAAGSCMCGAVEFTADDVETDVHCCHCEMCVRWNGGPALAVAVGNISFEGEDYISRYASSDWAERGFCNACGTHLFYQIKASGQYILWVGVLNDKSHLKLAGEIFIDEKLPLYALAGNHPKHTGEEFMAMMQAQQEPGGD